MNRHFLPAFAILFLFTFLSDFNTLAQNLRPVRDDVGFCWTKEDISALIHYLDKSASDSQAVNNIQIANNTPIAGISPHDDYLYAGDIYYPLFKKIKAKEIIIFGVTHGTVRKEIGDPHNVIILDDFSEWTGPFGPVKVSPLREQIKNGLDPKTFNSNNKAQTLEHSLEAMIPFLQYYNQDIKITPIMITGISFDKMNTLSSQLSKIITKYIKDNNLTLGKDIFFLISSDANHYGADFNNTPFGDDEAAHSKATENDKRIAETFFNNVLDKTQIQKLSNELWAQTPEGKPALSWCGRYSIPFGLLTTTKIVEEITHKHLNGRLLKYSDTWSEGVIPIKHTHLGLTAPFSLKHWVGFLSAAFYLE
ncbi:MAG: AmmeMemoRadiSam system protein B [Bacteroidota bacterium]|nr:AmmeMemoRadiSam system protein B [Bacteroidota bacterium]